jgi:hypothetical protein
MGVVRSGLLEYGAILRGLVRQLRHGDIDIGSVWRGRRGKVWRGRV